MLFAGRGRTAGCAMGRPGRILDCGGPLQIEVLHMEVMIGLRDFTE